MTDPWQRTTDATYGREAKNIRDRFLSLVNKTETCWTWTGYIKPDTGYGQFSMKRENGKWGGRSSHVVSYELFKGVVPDDMDVCHKCDEPKCVNPEHLFLGTRSANMRDARNKGRHPTAKLSPEQVSAIRARYAQGGISHRALAKEFNVCGATVSHILSGRNWKEVS